MEELFAKRPPEYPWQLDLPPWAPAAKMTEAERRSAGTRSMFDFWKEGLDNGMGHPGLFLDERRGFFRFSDGTLALSRERANWPTLKEKGFFSEWGR